MRRKNLTGERIASYITQALLILMRSEPYAKITIAGITERAGVDRTTYYRHFSSKEEIISKYLDSIMQEFLDVYQKSGSTDFTQYILTIFRTIYLHKDNLLLIHRTGQSYLLLNVLSKRFLFDEFTKNATVEKQYEISYTIGGIYNNCILWFSRGMKETPEQMSKIAQSFKTEESLTMLNVSTD
ncbi:TetR/AcrR family transcriptional regulator [Clostridium fermenticellae]|uniref:TetR/AcrR family transcriptional regulator n=1 Tax=Clostridium fermenticellae TaxID=2068654 RepID=A0A386H1J7_9CLOT|nr:TetR/AcrR family transcriptional regulator [Clostridium fermenticellae]AYD39433.1 TetR/AcrR family transcriptional regulator [Clostridium fermenticellae]